MGNQNHNCFSEIFIPMKRSGCPKCGSGLHVDTGTIDDLEKDVIMFCSDCGYDSSEDDKSAS